MSSETSGTRPWEFAAGKEPVHASTLALHVGAPLELIAEPLQCHPVHWLLQAVTVAGSRWRQRSSPRGDGRLDNPNPISGSPAQLQCESDQCEAQEATIGQ